MNEVLIAVALGCALLAIAMTVLWLRGRGDASRAAQRVQRAQEAAREAEGRAGTLEAELSHARQRLADLERRTWFDNFPADVVFTLAASGRVEDGGSERWHGIVRDEDGRLAPFLVERSIGHLAAGDTFTSVRGQLVKLDAAGLEARPAPSPAPAPTPTADSAEDGDDTTLIFGEEDATLLFAHEGSTAPAPVPPAPRPAAVPAQAQPQPAPTPVPPAPAPAPPPAPAPARAHPSPAPAPQPAPAKDDRTVVAATGAPPVDDDRTVFLAPGAAAAPGDPDVGLPFLSVIEGPDQGRRFPVPFAGATVGREPGNTVALSDGGTSRVHCRLDYEGNRFVLRDNHSTNGTLCNDQRVTEQELSFGDVVHVADTRMRFTCEGFELRTSDPPAAARAFEQTLVRDPDFVPALKNLAFLLEKDVARKKEAQPLWDRLARLEP